MANQQFSINQQVFEIDFFSTAKAYELQNRISGIVNGELPTLMNRYFETVVPEEFLYKIDSLVLDIGEVLYDNLEAEITSKFMEALMKELSDRFRFAQDPAFAQQSGVAVSRAQTGLADLLEYFLLTGRLPWWANREVDMEATLSQLFLGQKHVLRELILRVGRYDYVRRRIANRFRRQYMEHIIETLEPQEAVYIFGYHKEVVKIQKEEQVVVTEQAAFEKAVWLFILDYLLADRGGAFNRKSFVKSTLQQIASGFNVFYFDLLHVFFNALRLHEGSSETASLENLIRELSNEDTLFMEQETIRSATKRNETGLPDTGATIDKLELLRYYLSYGTMPFSNNALSKEELVEVFFELATKVPQTFRDMLLAAGITKEGAERLFTLFGVDGTKHFLKLVYPEKAKSIGVIGATFEMLQSEKVLVSSGNSSFREVLWKMMLDVILISRFAITDERVIIHSVITGLRKYYGLPLNILVENISEGIRSVFYKDMRNLENIGLFQRVLEEYSVASNEGRNVSQHALSIEDAPVASDNAVEAERLSKESSSLRDLLRFLIAYGSMPWWGKSYFSQTPAALLEQLARASAKEALLLFRFAGTRRATQERFLLQFPETLILDTILALPEGETAIRLWEQLRTIVLLTEPDMDRKGLLSILWEELIAHDYQFVTDAGLYLKAINKISAKYSREPLVVIATMRTVLADWTGDAVSRIQQLLLRIEEIFVSEESQKNEGREAEQTAQRQQKKTTAAYGSNPDFILQEHLFSSYAMLVPPKGSSELDVVREWLATSEESVRVSTTGKVFSILEAFLATGHLPGNLSIADSNTADVFIKRLLMLAYHVDAKRLTLLFEKQQGVLAMAHIGALLKEAAGGDEKTVALFLAPVVEKYSYPFNSHTETREEIIPPVNIENIIAIYLAPDTPVSEQQLLDGAANMLRYFLLWNRFPGAVKNIIPGNFSHTAMLNHLVLFIFKRDPYLLQQLVQNEEYQQPAMEILYTAVNALRGNEAAQIVSLVTHSMRLITERNIPQPTAEEINISHAPGLPTETPTNAAALAAQLLPEELDKRTADALVRDAHAVTVISERKDQRFYDAVMERTGYQSFSGYLSVTDNILLLFGKAFTDSLVREKMIGLFRKYNLQLAAGKQAFQSRNDYFLSFFRYIEQHRSPAGEIWQQVLVYVEKADDHALPALTKDLPRIRRSLRLLLKQEDARIAVDTATAATTQPGNTATGNDDAEKAIARKKLQAQVARELEMERMRAEAERKRKALESIKEKNTKIYIANSGLVILHPFFSFYFSNLGLLEKGIFIDEEKRTRAVLLMQYLVTGRDKFEEHELVLNKVLCGMPLEEPVPVEIELSQQEKDLSGELFGVLKQRWDQVKNSSIEGIRASFFQREGALHEIEEGWNLRVEQRGYDMLLQTLPWAFGFIKLPWMNKILTVEWI